PSASAPRTRGPPRWRPQTRTAAFPRAHLSAFTRERDRDATGDRASFYGQEAVACALAADWSEKAKSAANGKPPRGHRRGTGISPAPARALGPPAPRPNVSDIERIEASGSYTSVGMGGMDTRSCDP